MRHLFIAGPPRSGTTGLVFLLNEDPRIVVGLERYKRSRSEIDPYLFTERAFFAPVTRETDVLASYLYERLHARYRAGGVRVMGDKVPFYTRVLPRIAERFDDWRLIVLFREIEDVARSYAARAADPADVWPDRNDAAVAVAHWNQVYAAVRDHAASPLHADRVLLVPYDELLEARDPGWLVRVYAHLGLSPHTAALLDLGRGAAPLRHWGAPGVATTATTAGVDPELHTWCRARIEADRARYPGTAEAVDGGADGRDRTDERRRLIADLRVLATGDEDSRETLRARLDDALTELARRPGSR